MLSVEEVMTCSGTLGWQLGDLELQGAWQSTLADKDDEIIFGFKASR
jgi:hypothetical protein